MRYPKIIDELYGGKITVVQLVLTIPNPIDFVYYSLSQETIDTCNVTGYNTHMIKSFAHKGLKEFYETGSKRGIQAEHASKLERMLDRLDASTSPQDMNLPGYRLHPLKGDKQDMWSVWVNGNWRMTFYFEDQDAYLVDYMDYH